MSKVVETSGLEKENGRRIFHSGYAKIDKTEQEICKMLKIEVNK